jgi:hypothetical protein
VIDLFRLENPKGFHYHHFYFLHERKKNEMAKKIYTPNDEPEKEEYPTPDMEDGDEEENSSPSPRSKSRRRPILYYPDREDAALLDALVDDYDVMSYDDAIKLAIRHAAGHPEQIAVHNERMSKLLDKLESLEFVEENKTPAGENEEAEKNPYPSEMIERFRGLSRLEKYHLQACLGQRKKSNRLYNTPGCRKVSEYLKEYPTPEDRQALAEYLKDEGIL